ncbi:MAG: hypothetical protein H7240_11520 [Glaciimonas sp.]|nr:hypothetical protein [Glaciimonas sp.]
MNSKKINKFNITKLSLTVSDEASLANLVSLHGHACWSHTSKELPLTQAERDLICKFKSNLKNYLYKVGQGRFCCFCAAELDDHNATFDLEHLIAKVNKPSVVFHLQNLALSCKTCNSAKGITSVLVFPLINEFDQVYLDSSHYLIVNPHLDVWTDYLRIDSYRRVLPVYKNFVGKGAQTIRICGVDRKNAMRLADHFDFLATDDKKYDDWVTFYVTLCSQRNELKKTKYRKFLKSLLGLPADPAADELRNILAPVIAGT